MSSLSKKVPYLHDNFLLSAYQPMASSQGKVSLQSSFACMEPTLSPRIAKVLPADALFHLFTKVFLPICCLDHSPKFSITKISTIQYIEKFHWDKPLQFLREP